MPVPLPSPEGRGGKGHIPISTMRVITGAVGG